jgi:ATP-binding cassette, subfamily F, member 3
VALAKVLISEANFLLLDEPTNHLDMMSVNILIQALQQYEGSYVVVSHDRFFVSEIANKIWYIEDEQIKEYPGTYEEYEEWQSNRAESEKSQPEVSKKSETKTESKPVHKNNTSENQKLAKKIQQKIDEQENQISQLENQKKLIESKLADPTIFSNAVALKELNLEYLALQKKLKTANDDWETSMMELEEVSV